MAKHIPVTLEIGPNGKKVVAIAPDWPGLERGARTEEAALERLLSYVPRYLVVAKLAGLEAAFAPNPVVEVVERYAGTGSTDFWGISFAFSSIDQQPISDEELERELRLLQAGWAVFDAVRLRVSTEMQRGPRGGGRDREQIIGHIFATERSFGEKLGVVTAQEALQHSEGLKAHRETYCQAIREFYSQGKMARKWPLRYLIRHTVYHTLDHVWEMEDKNLNVEQG